MYSKKIDIYNEKKNDGFNKEIGFKRTFGIKCDKGDNKAYNVDSDAIIGNKKISIKSGKFSLMAGSLCNGLTDFDSIWNLYEKNVHSNTFVFITNEWIAYVMNIHEFKEFVYNFCTLARESKRNGGYIKIRLNYESKKIRNWLATQVA